MSPATTTNDLIERLASPQQTGLDPALLLPLLRLLTSGEPVEMADLAAASGRTVDDVRNGLAAVPDTEYDGEGRIVGQGLTLRRTRHQFTIDGEELYTWCALDTLIFPILLGRSAVIESASPVSGRPIRTTIDPSRVTSVEPATAVVSLVSPEDMASIRSAFCNEVHFFISPEDAQVWLEDHPGAEVLPVAEAYQLAALTATGLNQIPTGPAADPAGPDSEHRTAPNASHLIG